MRAQRRRVGRYMRYVVVSYDITDDKRRSRVHGTLKDFGAWIQFSVFELRIREQDFARLRHRLSEVIAAGGGDRVNIYELCSTCREKIVRIGSSDPYSTDSLII